MNKVLALALFGVVMWSCNNTSDKPAANLETTEAQHEHHSSDAIELNNGEKWQVNEEMRPYVEKGESLVEEYIKGGSTDYKQLAGQVEEQNKLLINSCTMDGKSHEELHKWLHPHLELVNALTDESDAAKAATIVNRLRESYHNYHTYFK